MGISRLIKGSIGALAVLGFGLPSFAQSFPSTNPNQANYAQTTVFQRYPNDFIVGSTAAVQGAIPSNMWVLGALGLQASTSLNFGAIAPISSLGQNTIFILPDPGSSSATLALQGGSSSFSSLVLTGTSFNTTLQSVAALGQAQTVTIPDSGASAANVVLSAGNATIGGVKTFTSAPIFPVGGIVLSGTSFNATVKALAGLGQATTYTIPDPGAAAADFIVTTGNANGQIAKARVFNIPLNGNTATGVLPVSETILFAIAPGRAGTIQKINAGAVTQPSGTSDVVVTVFKNSGSNAVTSAYDLNSTASGASASVPITGNSALLATDIVYVSVTTGASIGGCAGAMVSIEVLTTDY